jgi:hypothetical protein
MATRKQIAANRSNAEKSTGPRTVSGMTVSSRNAVKWGLLCRDLFRFPWEDAEVFQLMHARLLDELQPQGVRECLLVEHIFGLCWRLRRAPVSETGVLLQRVREVKGCGPNPYTKLIPTRHLPEDSGRETASEGGSDQGEWSVTPVLVEAPLTQPNIADIGRAHILDVQEGDAWSKVRRHETSLENSLFRALRELERLQEKRSVTMPPASVEDSDPPAPEDTDDPGPDGKAT